MVVEASAAMANSPSSRRDMVFAMLDRGLFNDPNTGKPSARGIKKVFEMLEFGNWESYEERRAIPENRAQWENHLMALGQQVSVWSWEDHEIHMEIHNVYRQTEEFYDLLQGPNGQGIAQQFEAHVQQHMGYLNAAAAPAGQPVPESAAPPPGGPPPAAMSPPTAEQLGPPPPTPAPAMTQPPSTFGQNPLNAILAQAHQLEQTQGPGAADQFMRAAVAQMQAGKG